MRALLILLSLSLATMATPRSLAEEESLRIAVASNFSQPLLQLSLAYAAATGETTLASSASTGVLYTQIRHGAPFDIFLAADSERPGLLVESGDAPADSRITYARGILVLAYRESLQVDAARGIDVLLARPDLTLAIANPELAPYGRAAADVLSRFPSQPRLLTGANVSQALQMFASGGADAALVAESYRPQHYLDIPGGWYAPIEQQAVILSRSDKPARARAFLQWLTGPEGRRLIESYGYDTAHD